MRLPLPWGEVRDRGFLPGEGAVIDPRRFDDWLREWPMRVLVGALAVSPFVALLVAMARGRARVRCSCDREASPPRE